MKNQWFFVVIISVPITINTLNAVGKYSPAMETESGKLTLNERKEWLKLKYPNSQLKTNIIYVLSNLKMRVAQSELFDKDRLLSTSMYESIPLNKDMFKAKEKAKNGAMMFSGFFLKHEEIR